MAREYAVWGCSECDEQITDPPARDPRTGKYKRGHYHDPPEGWWTDDGPGPNNVNAEDPWFDAVEVVAIDKRDVEPLVEAAREFAQPLSTADFLAQTSADIGAKYDALRRALATFEESEGS